MSVYAKRDHEIWRQWGALRYTTPTYDLPFCPPSHTLFPFNPPPTHSYPPFHTLLTPSLTPLSPPTHLPFSPPPSPPPLCPPLLCRDPLSKEDSGVQGLIKFSCTVLGPGDIQKVGRSLSLIHTFACMLSDPLSQIHNHKHTLSNTHTLMHTHTHTQTHTHSDIHSQPHTFTLAHHPPSLSLILTHPHTPPPTPTPCLS